MIQNMPADSEETDDLACYANHYESDADTETKLAILRYELCLDEDEVNGPPGEVCFYFSKQRNLLLIDHMLLLFKIQD
jgi:hypothetical protein